MKRAGQNSKSHEPAKVAKALWSCWKGVSVVLDLIRGQGAMFRVQGPDVTPKLKYYFEALEKSP